jgi:homoserine kinase
MPDSLRLVRELRGDGIPAVVSGAGPTVLVLTSAAEQQSVARRVPPGWGVLTPPVDRDGVRVRHTAEAPEPGRDQCGPGTPGGDAGR